MVTPKSCITSRRRRGGSPVRPWHSRQVCPSSPLTRRKVPLPCRVGRPPGEMVSLTAVEGLAATVWPDTTHAAVTIPDARKGEQLVLLTENEAAARAALLDHARENGIVELMVPREIHAVEKIPVLGTGKLDYVAIKALAETLVA